MVLYMYNPFVRGKLPIHTLRIPDIIPYTSISKPIRCSIYEYIHQGTTIYVGQTQSSLARRDRQHRNGNKTYFDRRLKADLEEAKIRLIDQKQFRYKEDGKSWMDRMEFIFIKKRQCLRSDSIVGCNTNRPRHFQKTQEHLVVMALKHLSMNLLHCD